MRSRLENWRGIDEKYSCGLGQKRDDTLFTAVGFTEKAQTVAGRKTFRYLH
jgi:hypothetical protein